jgi:hypothetical protein
MTDVAREFTESLKDLSPAERAAAIQRADALNTVATTLLSGNGPPALKPSRPT